MYYIAYLYYIMCPCQCSRWPSMKVTVVFDDDDSYIVLYSCHKVITFLITVSPYRYVTQVSKQLRFQNTLIRCFSRD